MHFFTCILSKLCNLCLVTATSFVLNVIRYAAKFSLHFTWVVDDVKCILVTCVCVSVCLSVTACLHYCMDPDVTWGSGRGCPLVVHNGADLQWVHGLRCYGSIVRTRNVSEYMVVLTLCLVVFEISIVRKKVLHRLWLVFDIPGKKLAVHLVNGTYWLSAFV